MKKIIILLLLISASRVISAQQAESAIMSREGEETKYLVIKPDVYNCISDDFITMDPAATINLEAKRILANLKESYYSHSTTVDEINGVYNLDCSGFAAYILRYTLNAHYAPIDAAKITGVTRPLASDFCAFFRNSPNISDPNLNPTGWMVVNYLRNVRPGDIITWDYVDPDNENTGHMVIVDTITTKFTTSVLVNGTKYWEYKIRVIDASSGTHYQDTRNLTTNTTGEGVGAGYIYFGVDSTGRIAYYKWSSRSGTPHFEIFGIGRAIPFPSLMNK